MDKFNLDLNDALVLKRAEMWLEVGRPMFALQEFKGLNTSSRTHPWAVQILAAISATSYRLSAAEVQVQGRVINLATIPPMAPSTAATSIPISR